MLNEILVYEKSKQNIVNLEEIGLYPVSYESIKFIHNPLSNKYSIYPDLRYFSNTKNTIYKNIVENIKTTSKSTTYNLIDFEITKDTIINQDLHLNNVNFIINEG